MNKYQKIVLVFILIIGGLLRLYHVNYPIADWHSHRQADTASVTTNILNGTGTFWLPTYHDLSNVQSGQENPNGYRMVELPIYNQISAQFSKLFSLPLEISSRLVNIIISLATGYVLYRTVKNLYVVVVFLFLPFSIFYSRAILPEIVAIFFISLSLYFLQKKLPFLFSLSLGFGLLIKPFVGLLLFPIFVAHFLRVENRKKIFYVIFCCIFAAAPFLMWRLHIQNYPAGIPAFKWLFQQGFSGESFVVGRPYWFRWLFWERLVLLILGLPLILPLIISIFKQRNWPYFAGILLYFSIIARGNVQHDYYQVLTLPFLAILVSYGLQKLPKIISISLLVTSIVLTQKNILPYYRINHPQIIYAGWKTDILTPKNSLIIAPYTGDTAFLYQTNRSGWPTEMYNIPDLLKQFSNPIYLVSVNNDTYTNMQKAKYITTYEDQNMILLDLRKPKL